MPIRRVKPADWTAYVEAVKRVMPNLDAISQREAFIFETPGGDVAGTIHVYLNQSSEVYIDFVAIRPAFEGNGYATQLVEFIKSGATSLGVTAVRASAETQQQHDWLVSLGFVATPVNGGWDMTYTV